MRILGTSLGYAKYARVAAEVFGKVWTRMGRSDEKLIKHKIWDLEIQHRDLDQTVITLDASGNVDQLLLRRMKLRKLNLKDQITKLKSQPIPDLNA